MKTIQAKLSFMAYSKNLTVKEMFYGAVCRTYEEFHPTETLNSLYIMPPLDQQSKPVDLDMTKKMIMKAINEYAIRGDFVQGKRRRHHHSKKKFDLNKLKELDKIIDSLSDSNLAYQVYYNERQQKRSYLESKYSLHRALLKEVIRLLFLNILCGIELAQVKLQRFAIQRELDMSVADKLAGWLALPKGGLASVGHALSFYDII
mmetsp:Transcript_29567/g.45085  ORF Transcript_29567/g.45085 Transcript_29567/m.45085 type:complete len:204 (+) Transcript_29567:1149-1760(+)